MAAIWTMLTESFTRQITSVAGDWCCSNKWKLKMKEREREREREREAKRQSENDREGMSR